MPTVRQSKKSANKKHKASDAGKDESYIDPTTPVSEIVAMHPDAEDVLGAYGLYCHNCILSDVDTLEDGARLHGLGDEDISNLVEDLNDLFRKTKTKSDALAITLTAARALKGIAEREGKKNQVLRVTTDSKGKFCMEFELKPGKNDKVFAHPKVPEIKIVASKSSLKKIGGSKIDLKEGKFTLDLDRCENCDGGCGCKK